MLLSFLYYYLFSAGPLTAYPRTMSSPSRPELTSTKYSASVSRSSGSIPARRWGGQNLLNLFKHIHILQVDMPVFFYIDPDFAEDPFMQNTNEITLSYTFFESKPGLQLPTYNPSVGR